jgi:tetratricopeptide (TPR) repeat protein
VLQQFSLVRQLEKGEIWVHQLLQQVVQGMLERQGKAKDCVCHVGHAISPYFPVIDIRDDSAQHVLRFSQDSIPEIKYNVAHAMKCTEGMIRYGVSSKEIGRIAWAASEQLLDLGLYDRAEPILESVLSLWNRNDDDAERERALIIGRLGTLKLWLRKFDEAIVMNQDALTLAQSIFGDRSLQVARAKHFLGYTHVQNGVPEKALILLQDAFTGKQEMLGNQHRDTASTAWVLGDMYQALGLNEKAEQAFSLCYEVRCKVLGQESQDSLDAALRLATVYQLQGKVSDAAAFRDRISQQESEFQSRKHEEEKMLLPDRLHMLSDAFWTQGNFKEAISLAERVLEIHTAVLGTGSPHISRLAFEEPFLTIL